MSQSTKFEALRSLVLAVQFGSIGQAAQVLAITQPALSQRIKELENEFGPLLERDAKGVQPTDAGKILVEQTLQAMQALGEAETQVAALRAKASKPEELRIGYSPSHVRLLTTALEAVLRRRPNLLVTTEEADSADVEKRVLEGLDVGLVYIAEGARGLETEKVRDTALRLLVRRAHPIAKNDPVKAKALEDQPLALPKKGMRVRKTIDDYFAEAKVKPRRIVLESDSVATLLWAVNAGIGMTILPGIRLTADEAFVRRRLAPEPPVQTTSLVWNKKRPPSEAAKAFAQAVHECVGRLD